ncbi:amidohydrolase [Paenibacillus sp. J22TS3]|uniref:amidohydrolase n=1 Tax=Paenibacillus sp. J22TS3 TaxID=2807192 RepID=UPI001B14735D|nr:amidohydrolase family protein [Paenibacillus sp. J22TS3]GIP23491.1 hydrolase [Paenibacillus sp. J22TS3]
METSIYADFVLISNHIFTGEDDAVIPGFVAVKEGLITAVGQKEDRGAWVGPDTVVRDFEDGLITAGFHDNHTFFTGSVLTTLGVDLSACGSVQEALDMLEQESGRHEAGADLYGHGWDASDWVQQPASEVLDERYPDRAVMLFNADRDYCWMNTRAMEKYHFSPEACNPEAVAELLQELVRRKDFIKGKFTEFSRELASRGITSIRDIAFDDYLGMLDVLEELEAEGNLKLRVHFSSQPNARPVDFDFGETASQKYQGDFIRFEGYKLMTDGIISAFTGDLLEPYTNRTDTTNLKPVDYGKIQDAALEADRRGFKVCIHAEGDAAVRKAVSILEACRQQSGWKLRHSIANLELSHPDDLKRMAEQDIIAEVYSQILLMNDSHDSSYMREFAGEDREGLFYNYGSMQRAGVRVTMGTDLPLMYPSIPDSLYAVSARLFPDGSPDGGWFKENGMPVKDVLKAWTLHAAYHHGLEDKAGSLAAGKYADIAVLDRNPLEVPEEDLRGLKVIFTMMNGEIVFEA